MCLGVALTLPYTCFLALTTAKVCLVFGLYSVHMMMAVVIERTKGRPGDSLKLCLKIDNVSRFSDRYVAHNSCDILEEFSGHVLFLLL